MLLLFDSDLLVLPLLTDLMWCDIRLRYRELPAFLLMELLGSTRPELDVSLSL